MSDQIYGAIDVRGALADRRRRQALSALSDRDPPVPLRELAVAVSEAGPTEILAGEPATDGGTSPDAARRVDESGDDERGSTEPERRVAIDLYHVHLPKLEAAGFLSFDPGSRAVTDWQLEDAGVTSP